MLLLYFFGLFCPYISPSPSPYVSPVPSFFCLSAFFLFQSPQWKDWKGAWWPTLVTLLMKRKTTPLPKPQGQVTLGLFSPPPPPQAGHRAIDALLHHHPVLKRSLSSRQCLSGWHPEIRKILTLPQYFVPSLTRRSPKTEPVFFQHSSPIHHMKGFAMCWYQDYFSTLVSNGHTNILENLCFCQYTHSLKVNLCRMVTPNYFVEV